MNINEEIFRSLYLELDNNKEALNTSSLLFDKAVNGTMDSRLKIGVINGKISSIETSFIKLKKENSENIDLSMNVKRYFDDLSNVLNMKIGTLSGEIPFSMYNDRDGISWIEKNMNKIEEQKANKATEFNNENIDIDALLEYYPDFKNYLEKFEKEYPFLKKLSAEGKKKLYEEAYYIYLTSQLNSNYYVNRDEILEIKKEQESLNISFSAISNVDAQSWSKEYKEKVKTTITGEGFDFIEYHQRYEYLVNKNYNDLTKEEMVEYDALDENINYIGEIAFKIKKNEDKLKAYGINSISIVNELESAYQSIKQTESSFVYGYIKYTNDFDEFVESRNNDYDYSFKHNGFREYSKYVNDDQRKIFDYLSINYGRESAENYYKSNLEEDFIIAKGVDEAYSYLEKINDENVFLQSGITAWEGLQDGFEGYFRNVGNMFAPTKKISSDDVKIQLIMKAFEGKILTDTLGEDRAKEVLEKLEKGEYTKDDIIKILNNEGKDYNSVLDGYVFNDENIKNSILKNMYTTSMVVGNMLPAMIAGKISAVVLKTTAFANLPVGTILTGISSGGSARNNALIDGYSEGEALAYSLVTGATTGLLEYYLSPFEGIGKNSVKFDSKTIMGVFRKFGLSAVSNVTEEIIEDSVQTLLIDNIMLGKTVTVDEFLDSSWETIKTAIMVSAFMGAPSITLNLGKIGSEKISNIKITPENISKLADIFKIENSTLKKQKLNDFVGNVYAPTIDPKTIFDIHMLDEIMQNHDSKYGKGSGLLALIAFSDPKSVHYNNSNIITSLNGARNLMSNFTPEQIKYIVNNFYLNQQNVRDLLDKNNSSKPSPLVSPSNILTYRSVVSTFNDYPIHKYYGSDQAAIEDMCVYYDANNNPYTYREVVRIMNKAKEEYKPLPIFRKIVTKEYFRLKDKLIDSGFSQTDASVLMSTVNDAGACSYAAVCNEIFMMFRDNEKLFEENFGYSMYKKNENGSKVLNTAELLLDMYVFANSSNNKRKFVIEHNNGNKTLNNKFLSNKVDPLNRRLLNATSQEFLSKHNVGKNNNLINEFLTSKNPNLYYTSEIAYNNNDKKVIPEQEYTDALKQIKNKLDSGYLASMDFFYNPKKNDVIINMYSYDTYKYNSTSTAVWQEGGGHAVFITEINNKGIVVSSWGNKYLIPHSDLMNGGRFQIELIYGGIK